MEAKDLLTLKKINDYEYKTYLLFSVNDMGRDYLSKAFDGTHMEEPPSVENECPFAWMDGRRSIWRDVKRVIEKVNFLLKEVNKDERIK